jgi:hypothetical protein
MTPGKAKALLPVFTAFAEGKTIQCQDISGDWIDMRKDAGFVHDASCYRIKPEPIVVRREVVVYKGESGHCIGLYRLGNTNVEFIFDDATEKLIDVKFIGKQGESK